jgi:hypothetical protein
MLCEGSNSCHACGNEALVADTVKVNSLEAYKENRTPTTAEKQTAPGEAELDRQLQVEEDASTASTLSPATASSPVDAPAERHAKCQAEIRLDLLEEGVLETTTNWVSSGGSGVCEEGDYDQQRRFSDAGTASTLSAATVSSPVAKRHAKWQADIVDPSVLFGLERGILSMMNILISVTLTGGGLMYINAGETPRILGAAIVILACFFMLMSYAFFAHRLRVLSRGGGASVPHSMIWIGTFTCVLLTGIGAALFYSIIYPPDSIVWSAPVTVSEE